MNKEYKKIKKKVLEDIVGMNDSVKRK